MNRKGFLIPVLVVLMGCAGKAMDVAVVPDHPAHPDAAQVAFEAPSNVLATEERAETPAILEDVQSSHSEMTLPKQAEATLIKMLDAYFTIGDRLASDSVEEVAQNAQQMLEALASLTQMAPPDAPHFWHQHAQEAEVIREHTNALAQTPDLDGARQDYASVSDALRRLLATVGIPKQYAKPVVGFVCGMFPDVPENGLWLQIGNAVRNPYFGTAMPRCYSETFMLPIAGKEDMEPGAMPMHEHRSMEQQDAIPPTTGHHDAHEGVHQ